VAVHSTAPCPTTPGVVLQDTPIVSKSTPPIPPQVNLVASGAAYCSASTSVRPPNQLYYQNTANLPGTPDNGFICVNSRDNPIPDPVIASNQSAHTAIKAYLQANNIPASPWLFYKRNRHAKELCGCTTSAGQLRATGRRHLTSLRIAIRQ